MQFYIKLSTVDNSIIGGGAFLKTSLVFLSKKAEKQLQKLPQHIKEAVFLWAKTVEKIGIYEARKCSGYHDEPLKGLA